MNTNAKKLSRSKDKVANRFQALVDSAEELLRTTADYTGEEVVAAREKFTQQLDVARGAAVELEAKAVDQYRRASEHTEEYVRTNPWKALGIAAVAGALLSCAMSPRRR